MVGIQGACEYWTRVAVEEWNGEAWALFLCTVYEERKAENWLGDLPRQGVCPFHGTTGRENAEALPLIGLCKLGENRFHTIRSAMRSPEHYDEIWDWAVRLFQKAQKVDDFIVSTRAPRVLTNGQ